MFSKIKNQSRQFGVPWWELPDFLLVSMALVNIAVMVMSYKLYSAFEEDPRYVIALVAAEAVLVIVIGNVIVETSKKVVMVNKLKKEFVEISSHQMRSPLSTIKWYIEMLQNDKTGSLNGKQKELIKTISDANSKILGVVNDLLNVSDIESGSYRLATKKINLVAALDQAVAVNKPLAELKRIKISFKQSGEKYFAMADPEKARIVFENIVGNAVKYTGDGGNVSIRIYREPDSVVCEISDDGIGIDKEESQLIFQKFYRTKKTRRGSEIGTGLGLYICKALLGRMKGNIRFESGQGKGTSFFVSFPKA